MKKTPFLFSIFILMATIANAQLTENTMMYSGGLSLGTYGKYRASEFHDKDYFDHTSSMPFYIQIEKGFQDQGAIAEYSHMLSYGLYFGYRNMNFEGKRDIGVTYVDLFYDHHLIEGGVLASFHFTPLLEEINVILDPSKYDLYGTVRGGLTINRQKTNFDKDNSQILEVDEKSTEVLIYIGLRVGGRYYLTKKLAGFVEFGPGNYSMISAGLTFKLN